MTTHRQALEFMDSFLESKGSGYNLPEAQAYAVLTTAEGLDVQLLQSDKDVYDLLDTTVIADALRITDFVALVTCGWATKIDDNLPPSKSPNRVRVRLVVITDKNSKQGSVMRIEGEGEAMFDEGQAHGSLADALRRASKRKSFDEAIKEMIDQIAKGDSNGS
jgi:hypothetical protein